MTRKVIVTTTIGHPTDAIRKYDALDGWNLIVVGDKRTPKYKLARGRFIPWQEVESLYPELCSLIGFNCTQLGRMVGLLEAAKLKPELVASIDDDCDPYPGWPGLVYVGKEHEFDCHHTDDPVSDPLWYAGYEHPARGYPPQLSCGRDPNAQESMGITYPRKMTPLLQEMFWDGEADYDACWRVHGSLFEYCGIEKPFWSDAFSPVNTQNTLIAGSVLRDYCGELPFVGHVSDIWAGYLFQARYPNSTLYAPANVRHWQDRTLDSVLKDLTEEQYSYRYALDYVRGLQELGPDRLDRIACLPLSTIRAIDIYRAYF